MGLPILDDAVCNSAANGIRSNDGYLIAVPTGGWNTITNVFPPDICPLDPWLDWAVGRAGIPYFDYGTFNSGWVRSQVDASPYLSKKQFVNKA